MYFQNIINSLNEFWIKQGCIMVQPYDIEKGAGTFNPATFFGVLTEKPWSVCYVEPSRRPGDGRFAANPNRLGKYYQYQVIMKPPPKEIQKIYIKSLESIGIKIAEHDIKFVEDDWESPTLGASGIGWEVWLDGMEITQFTYFQQMASFNLFPVSVEITYGLERLCMFSQKKNNVFDIKWNEKITYGDVHKEMEKQFSIYSFELTDIQRLRDEFDYYESRARFLVEKNLYYPAYDMVMKSSHNFNMLMARGALSVTERTTLIKKIRDIARLCAKAYIEDNSNRQEHLERKK
ncbi:MAG: glycine--tRNA ligase subunit alpha [Elusimicrobiota bacterium]